jgi:hypothetical protein
MGSGTAVAALEGSYSGRLSVQSVSGFDLTARAAAGVAAELDRQASEDGPCAPSKLKIAYVRLQVPSSATEGMMSRCGVLAPLSRRDSPPARPTFFRLRFTPLRGR